MYYIALWTKEGSGNGVQYIHRFTMLDEIKTMDEAKREAHRLNSYVRGLLKPTAYFVQSDGRCDYEYEDAYGRTIALRIGGGHP